MRLPTENAVPIGAIDAKDAGRWCTMGTLLVPYGGFLAAELQAGETVLVNGATGSFGSAAVAVALAMRGFPQRRIKHVTERESAFATFAFRQNGFCERGRLTAVKTDPPSSGCLRTRVSGNRELAFLGDPFESFGRTLDTILTVVALGRKQPNHLIGAAGGRTGNIAGSKIDSLSNGVLMLQRPLHHARTPAVLTVPPAFGLFENPATT